MRVDALCLIAACVVLQSRMQLVFEQIRAGGDRNFGYLLGDRDAKRAVLIDPSYSPDAFVTRATEQGLIVSHVINTHGHPDHVNGNARVVEMMHSMERGEQRPGRDALEELRGLA